MFTKHMEADKNRYNKSQEKKEKESIQKLKARADNKFRKRDVRFKDAGRYKKKVVNWKPKKGKHYFAADDFVFNDLTAKMLRRFDNPEGRSIYSKRMGTVELLYCIVHNIGKIQRYGTA